MERARSVRQRDASYERRIHSRSAAIYARTPTHWRASADTRKANRKRPSSTSGDTDSAVRRAPPTADDTTNRAITNGALLGIADSQRRAETGGRLVRPRSAVGTGRATSGSVLPVGACSAASDATRRQRDRRLHQLEMRGVNVRGEGKEEPIRATQIDFGKRPISETEGPADEPQSRKRRARHVAEVVVDEPTAAEPTIKFKDSKEDAVITRGAERTREIREHHSCQRSRRTTRHISTAV